ncbi:LANO_0G17150g1_1 [Lachancea nothofagi CBS 11611]|uniref:LANO_0G17150g1_1 n=1 Tax=Lachancea nothofagi CBS 11611 TaxID=1266666 RepID=A0A1G4KKE4_9SACH|nr:LANO_0G17150g1_1 [Lachancea nothofagi CBS 11611]
MGYIQFDKVDVPEDNVVPLGLLNRQLQKQQLGGMLKAGDTRKCDAGKIAAALPATAKNIRTRTSSTTSETDGISLARTSTQNTRDCWSQSVHTTLSPTSVSLAQMWAALLEPEHCNDSTDNSGNKPSLDEELCGMRFDSVPFAEFDYLTADKVSPCTDASSGKPSSSASSKDVSLPWPSTPAASAAPETLPSPPTGLQTASPDSEQQFKCGFCSSSFKVKGYLTRHMKKHLINKEFQCPFWCDQCRCHPTGEFSRKDTYKTHLKSIHFVYPVGVAKNQRWNSKGRCAACFQEFSNNTDWFDKHVAKRACSELAVNIKEESELQQNRVHEMWHGS